LSAVEIIHTDHPIESNLGSPGAGVWESFP
jgi:hypothetical protein